MNKTKRIMALVLCLCLALAALSGCGAPAQNDDEITGDDWRTTGVVDGYGTIVRGDATIDVCICVDNTQAVFYYDQAERKELDRVVYPVRIDGSETSFDAISFDDLDMDGNGDVQMFFSTGDVQSILTWLWTDAGYVLDESRSDYSTFLGAQREEEGDLSDYVGLWKYDTMELWVNISADGSWEMLDSGTNVLYHGDVQVGPSEALLVSTDGGDPMTLSRLGDELVDGDGDVLTAVPANEGVGGEEMQGGEEQSSYGSTGFAQAGLSVDCICDAGTYLLSNGAASYELVGGGNFHRGDVYWEVTKIGDYTHDGMREIEFDAICYIPEESVPFYQQDFQTVVTGELFDSYSGKWLTADTSYDDTSRGENHYVHMIEWNGGVEEIEFFYSTDWGSEGDWNKVLRKSYIVYMPEDYDGLVFAAIPQPDNYKETMTQMQLSNVAPEGNIMELPVVNPYASLYFAIN